MQEKTMNRITWLCGAALAATSVQAWALGANGTVKDCLHARHAGGPRCAGVQRVRVELPPSPAASSGVSVQTVSTSPQPGACQAGKPAGYTVNSSGRVDSHGC
jgi:hypothetical protein